MGNPLSPIVANFWLWMVENKIKSKPWFPRHWYRYMDDIFAIIPKTETEFILEKLNNIHPNIKFTQEIEKDNRLPFLDIWVLKKLGKLEFGIYHKPSSTNQCIPYESHHPISHKLAVFHASFHRLCNIVLNKEEKEKELQYIYKTAWENGYAKNLIEKIYKKTFAKIRENK